MKRQIISIVMLFIALAICIWELIFLKFTINEFKNNIYNIQSSYSDKNSDEAINKTNSVIKDWKNHKTFLSSFINHDPLDEIETSLETIKIALENDENEDFLVECKKSLILLDNIRDTETPSIGNIL